MPLIGKAPPDSGECRQVVLPVGGNVPPGGGVAGGNAPAGETPRIAGTEQQVVLQQAVMPAGGNLAAGGVAQDPALEKDPLSRKTRVEKDPALYGAGGGVTADQLGGVDPNKLDTLNKDDLGNLSTSAVGAFDKDQSLTSIP